MDVAITGASGLIGTAVAEALTARGDRVVRLVRPQTEPLQGDALPWDPRAGTIDAEGLEGVDAVIHLAGAGIGERRWTEARKDEILRSRVDGTSLLTGALAALRRPPSVLLSASAVGYYGDRGDERLTETSAPGTGFRAEVCTAWEAAARPAADAGVRTVVLRIGNVLTPSGGLLPFLLLPWRLGLGARFGSGRQWFPWVSLRDQVRAMTFLLDAHALAGPVNVVAPEAVTNAAFASALGGALGRPAPWRAPAAVLEVVAGRERAREALLSSALVEPAVLEQAGFVFADPALEPALRAMLEAGGRPNDIGRMTAPVPSGERRP